MITTFVVLVRNFVVFFLTFLVVSNIFVEYSTLTESRIASKSDKVLIRLLIRTQSSNSSEFWSFSSITVRNSNEIHQDLDIVTRSTNHSRCYL